MISRAKLRGSKLDENCKQANTTTKEYGLDDNRVFCYGLYDCRKQELVEKCLSCKALVFYAEPLVKEKQNESGTDV